MFWAKNRPVPECTTLFGCSSGSLITCTKLKRRSADDRPAAGTSDEGSEVEGTVVAAVTGTVVATGVGSAASSADGEVPAAEIAGLGSGATETTPPSSPVHAANTPTANIATEAARRTTELYEP
jgi:hypothetical protein